jgi:hypothetical protein
MIGEWNNGTGRRKSSVARVFMKKGTGKITVNHREFQQFFTTESLRMQVRRPLTLTEMTERFDVLATVAGGGEQQRLTHDHDRRLAAEVLLDRPAVHQDLAGALLHEDARNRRLAPAGAVVPVSDHCAAS